MGRSCLPASLPDLTLHRTLDQIRRCLAIFEQGLIQYNKTGVDKEVTKLDWAVPRQSSENGPRVFLDSTIGVDQIGEHSFTLLGQKANVTVVCRF